MTKAQLTLAALVLLGTLLGVAYAGRVAVQAAPTTPAA